MATWFITGTSTGLGRALAETAAAAGHRVAATARDPESIRDLERAYPDTVAAIALDVTDAVSRSRAVAAATDRLGPIDVLVNNAGYGYSAAVEEGEDDAVAAMFATNVFGPIALAKAVLPAMRQRRSGLIVSVSSIGARITMPGGGYYSAAKAAIEAVSGSLAKELESLGVHVMVVEPGSFRTDFRSRSAKHSEVRISDYDAVLGREPAKQPGPQRGDPVKAARAILTAAARPVPPALLLLGSDALAGYRSVVAAQTALVGENETLTLSTDANV